MKHLLSVTIPALIVLLSACKKQGLSDTRFYGQVIDSETRIPIQGMRVQLEFLDGDAGVGLNLSSYTVGETYTDADGNYSFSLNAKADDSLRDRYRLSGWKEGYFGFGAEPSCKDADYKSNLINAACFQQLVATLRVVHQGVPNYNDFIKVSTLQPNTGHAQESYIFGADSVYDVILEVAPNHSIVGEYTPRKNGVNLSVLRDTFVITQNGQVHTIQW